MSWVGHARIVVLGIALVALASCAADPTPPHGSPIAATSLSGPTQAPPSSTPSSRAASPTATIGTGGGPAPSSAPAQGRILFARHNLATDDVFCYTIQPDGTGEAPWGSCGPLSPDGSKILTGYSRPNGFGPLVDARPATVNVDGAGFHVLDAYPGRKISVSCTAWSPDGKRLLCESGQDESAADDGIYTLRASDGGDLRRLTRAPAGGEDQPWGYSPDGRRILFVRSGGDGLNVVFVMNASGTGLMRLSPVDLSASDFDSPAAWSPDGAQVAFAATSPSVGLRSVYAVNADGSGLKEISPAYVGGISVRWSPDGRWVAFTSRLCCQPQVWIVHPDGTGATDLTGGGDGFTAFDPLWTPDGSTLMFHRVDSSGHQSLWLMNADGSDQRKIADAGDGFDVGAYWWLATSTGPRAACPFPDGGACGGPLAAGSHTSLSLPTPVTFVVPEGWVNFEDLPGNLAFLPPGGDIDGVDAGTSDSLGIAANVAAGSPDCSGRPEPGIGRSARAIARALATRPGLAVTGPTAVTLGGLKGYMLDIRLAKGWTKMSCTGQPDVPLLVGVAPSDFADAILGDIAIRMYLLDDGDRTISVEIGDVSGGGRIASYMSVVHGLRFMP